MLCVNGVAAPKQHWANDALQDNLKSAPEVLVQSARVGLEGSGIQADTNTLSTGRREVSFMKENAEGTYKPYFLRKSGTVEK